MSYDFLTTMTAIRNSPLRRSSRNSQGRSIRNSQESRSIKNSKLEPRLSIKNSLIEPGDRESRSVMNNRKKIIEEFPILKLIPSKSAIDVSSPCSPKFDLLTKTVLDIKSKLINKQDVYSEFLVKSADKIIHIVDRYRDLSKPHPFSPARSKFLKPVPYTKFVEDVDDSRWTSFKNLPQLSDKRQIFLSSWNCVDRNEEFAKLTPEHQKFEPDHPIVSLIGYFAVAAFNEACEMHKWGEANNLHDIEFMECKYEKISNGAFLFSMTIEAVEEGIPGVYEAQVLCHSDGSQSLTKFILTDRIPTGTKAIAISLFSCVRSLCETLKCDIMEKQRKLKRIFNVTKGPHNGIAWGLLDLLDDVSNATVKGLVNVFSLGIRLLLSPDCNRTTNPDVWSHPDNHSVSCMVPREMGAPCRGYDYLDDSRPLQTI